VGRTHRYRVARARGCPVSLVVPGQR
jgi:hypothetical protein